MRPLFAWAWPGEPFSGSTVLPERSWQNLWSTVLCWPSGAAITSFTTTMNRAEPAGSADAGAAAAEGKKVEAMEGDKGKVAATVTAGGPDGGAEGGRARIYLAGGCFWGLEKYLSLIPGVLETTVGYANGKTDHPTYQEVCGAGTDHAETVEVIYQPERLSLDRLLTLFYQAIDPTMKNRQGMDFGRQYRTGIYYEREADRLVAEASLAQLQTSYAKPLAVELLPLVHFYRAEEEHQRYLDKNPRGYCHIGPSTFRRLKQMGEDQ